MAELGRELAKVCLPSWRHAHDLLIGSSPFPGVASVDFSSSAKAGDLHRWILLVQQQLVP